MVALGPELLVLPALALAAGVDLYLTLLLLGSLPALGLWPQLPGALADLASPGVLVLTGLFYLGELVADRRFAPALVWHGLHVLIRPLAGALLALLVLDGEPTGALVGGAGLAAALSFLSHATATGGSLLLLMDRTPPVSPLLASLLEDSAVAGLVVLALDRPDWSAGAVGLALLAALPLARPQIRAFLFSVRLALARLRRLLGGGGWTRPGDFPAWLVVALTRRGPAPVALRATPGAGLRLPGRPRLVLGWIVIGDEAPVFVHGRRPEDQVDLARLRPRGLEDAGFLRCVPLCGDTDTGSDGPARDPLLLLPRDGPSLEILRAELGLG